MLNRFEQFTSAISAIYRYIQKIEQDEMEKYGLRGAFAQYLLAIDRYPNGITAADLCEICEKDKAAVSRILTEMETKGLLAKGSSGTSQYKQLHKLTDTGRAVAQFVREKATIAVKIAGNGLGEPERKAMYETLNLIASNLQTICRSGIPTSFNKEIGL